MKILPTRNKAPSKIIESTKIKNWLFCGFFNSFIKLKTVINPKQIYNKIINVSGIINTSYLNEEALGLGV